jgi:thymidine phosphorylase
MQTHEGSLELAKTLVAIGNGFGKETLGFVTDMGAEKEPGVVSVS